MAMRRLGCALAGVLALCCGATACGTTTAAPSGRSLVALGDSVPSGLNAAKGEAYVHAAAKVTDDVNEVIKSAAAESGSAYVDLRAAFKGPNYSFDETHYLSSDGDHPSAAGHRRIAAAADTVIEQALRGS